MNKEFDPTEHYIRMTVKEQIELIGELWSIYEALCKGLAETSVDIFKGRSMIAAATQRIGKLLGLDKITNATSEEEESQNGSIREETVTGDEATRFHNLLENPPYNPEKDKMIDDAIRAFPNPDEPTEIDLEIVGILPELEIVKVEVDGKETEVVLLKKEEVVPRSDVVISDEHADTFIKMVDEPVFNKGMADLMREATDTFPTEVSIFPIVTEEEEKE